MRRAKAAPPPDPIAFRQSLLELLETDPPHEEKLLERFEAEAAFGPLYSSILYILTHLTFTEAEARRHWKKIRSHRDRLKGGLGRDVGLRVAILDYFVNLNRELKNPKIIEIAIYERTERSAITDGLTGLYNHAFFLQALRRELNRCRRHNLEMSLVMFDLDDFKKLNDTRGHLEGDKVLMKAAALVKETLREVDVAARYGGEEFAAILPDTTKEGARIVAERIRAHIADHFKRRRGGPRVTASGGVASYPEDAESMEDIIQRADEGLYRSKAAGKNRITLAQPERRRFERLAADQVVELKGEALEAAARARNVSRGGLLVSLDREVPVGSGVRLTIRPAVGDALAVRGEVVRVEKAEGEQQGYEVAVRLESRSFEPMVLMRRGH
ncbi:MAG TPA: diguanylate cyclase [Vicinamibacteria bacterium]|nr:diguanylate cyclase [Vicinamibacteria bacterium]